MIKTKITFIKLIVESHKLERTHIFSLNLKFFFPSENNVKRCVKW